MTALTRLAKLKELAQSAALRGHRGVDIVPHDVLALIEALEECVDTLQVIEQPVPTAIEAGGMPWHQTYERLAKQALERIEKLLGDEN